MKSTTIYAHTLDGCTCDAWEPLYGDHGHAIKVAKLLKSFRSPFVSGVISEPSPLWEILGRYHDMGKASPAWQHYLQCSAMGKSAATVDHKTVAARWWWDGRTFNPFGTMLAYAFCGHHSGLPNGIEMFGDRFQQGKDIHMDEALSALPPEWKEKPKLPETMPRLPIEPSADQKPKELASECLFQLSFMTRMFHSALVDADWLATESFCAPEQAAERHSATEAFASITELSNTLEAYLTEREAEATGRINALRREIHTACHTAATQEPGIFQLNVPTGGGKTLSSLSFALEHAHRHDLQRIIYVIPYTSIIDQTADDFRKVLGNHNVVEHHSNLDEGKDTDENRYASENWDAPLIVTTAVQFFESLFSASNRRCRKLHNIAHSVIVFDEAQTLPTNLLHPCLMAMKTLRKLCGCTLVLCTATQPKLERHQDFKIGFDPGSIRSLIGTEMETRLARKMKRVEVTDLGRLDRKALIAHVRECGTNSALIIVNLTRQAQEIYDALAEARQDGLFHLSARMCPAHRREVLATVRCRLKAGEPTVLVATRVVEAGVDISFPVVYRDACGLDSLAQAAGRCNRHGETAMGQVYTFIATDYPPPSAFVDLVDGIHAREDAVQDGDDIFSPEVITHYFQYFYQKRGERSMQWDNAEIIPMVGQEHNFMQCWNFPEIEKSFRLIPGGQASVLVPYGETGEALRHRLQSLAQAGLMPTREDFRAAQQVSVSVYASDRTRLQVMGDWVHEKAGLFMLSDERAYSPQTGLLRDFSELSYIC